MDTVGLALLLLGSWTLYGASKNFNPIQTLGQVFTSPKDAATTIDAAIQAGASANSEALASATTSTNTDDESDDSVSSGATPSSTTSKAAAKAYAKKQLNNAAEYDALLKLWNRESGWRYNAKNKSSGAYGIPQALPATKMKSAGSDYKTNAITQVKWGLSYIKSRYGTPSKAWAHEVRYGWY